MKRLATIAVFVGFCCLSCAAEKPKADNKSSAPAESANDKAPATPASDNSPESGDSNATNATNAATTGDTATTGLPFETITFASADGLEVTADLYLVHPKSSPMVVAFHQAGWSRGEYREIAPKLNAAGFNVMAVDARSGGDVNDVKNETAARAKKAGKKTSYTEALPDLVAALKLAREKYATGKVVSWGSSYSSALVIYLAGTEPTLADATLSFAPGEYFAKEGKGGKWIQEAAAKIKTPVFITSAKSEEKNWRSIYDAIGTESKVSFLPKTKGNHGSRALWKRFPDAPAYWTAVNEFLAPLLK